MRLALFDLDNTLLDGDSDHGWARFLVRQGVLDGEAYDRRNDAFFEDYKAGRLDIFAFLAFQLRPLAELPTARLLALRERFVREVAVPMILPAARRLVEAHRAAGDLLAVVTATNSFVTRPIAQAFGIDELVATEPEMREGRFTGGVAGVPSFREGKVTRVRSWLAGRGANLAEFASSLFYSDSHNDLPLLEAVTDPVAVDPDPLLRSIAGERSWPVISLRG